MLSSKIETMKPILESTHGPHLTAYIKNRGDLFDLRNQIQEALALAEEHLAPVMNSVELGQFLGPIKLFLDDSKRLKSFKGSIGIFRTDKSFRALSLPIEVEALCVVADTFHIKPLLKWLQVDREFLLLGLESGSASLYQGDLYSLRHIDTIIFPDILLSGRENGSPIEVIQQWPNRQTKLRETMEWLNGWIINLTMTVRPRLFVAGKKEFTRLLLQTLQYENLSSIPISSSFSHHKSEEIGSKIRAVLRASARKNFERALVDFHNAVDINQAKGNIFAIAKDAVRGKIRKLLIAESIQIFGKLNRKNGELKINGRDVDHEDDDILDDIAQTVLAHGGEVTVAARGEIPRGRPILAIVDDSPPQPEMRIAL